MKRVEQKNHLRICLGNNDRSKDGNYRGTLLKFLWLAKIYLFLDTHIQTHLFQYKIWHFKLARAVFLNQDFNESISPWIIQAFQTLVLNVTSHWVPWMNQRLRNTDLSRLTSSSPSIFGMDLALLILSNFSNLFALFSDEFWCAP